MQNKLKSFLLKIEDFSNMQKSEQVDLFAYFLMTEIGMEEFGPVDIKKCFDCMNIPAYSNIGQYLSKESKNKKSKKYIKRKNGYVLTKDSKDFLDKMFDKPIILPSTDNLYSKEILKDTRKYIVDISEQARLCYDHGLYDACSVMLRKLLEVLIIETFERHMISNIIKNQADDFLFLSDLINKLLAEKSWNIGRNAKKGFIDIKKLGDQSAHNRRFLATKTDIDTIKTDMRICIQELVSLIDYQSWNKELASK